VKFESFEDRTMQKLVEGIHHFISHEFGEQKELFDKLAKTQHPQACFITCSDSRIDPNLITTTDPGDLFVVRNPGNIVPPIGNNSGEASAVEFAMVALGVKDIIVCGHTGCGAMKGLLDPQSLEELPLTGAWLKYAGATQQIIRDNYQHLSGDALVTAAAEENVLVQLEHLRTLPIIASRLGRQQVRLHAWMYKIATGQMFAYDSHVGEFRPLGTTTPTIPQ
jgi:carbonic anhydrase